MTAIQQTIEASQDAAGQSLAASPCSLILGDCLEAMKNLPDKSVDAIITDPPYNMTGMKWDVEIDWAAWWMEANRISRGAIVMTSSQPFTSLLIHSNSSQFKHEIIWFKNVPTGMSAASYAPMKYHENIVVFCEGKIPTFNKQMEPREGKGKACYQYQHYCGESNHVKMAKVKKFYDEELVNPSSVVLFNSVPNRKGKVHPTQKPVELMRYLVRTYTNLGDVILDPYMGSGTTCLAAKLEGRGYIGIEREPKYFETAKTRIEGDADLFSANTYSGTDVP